MPTAQPLNRTVILRLSAVMTVIMTATAWGIAALFHDGSVVEMLHQERSLAFQLPIGLGFGVVAAFVVSFSESVLPGMEGLQKVTRDIHRQVRPTILDMALVSLAAGWGEELLFRGAVQPVTGLWIAAALFALGHGVLTRLTWGRIAFTAFLFGAGVLLGLLYEWAGLAAAMMAHATYDFVVLLLLRRQMIREGVIPATS
ncbi:CPBP family intramembrane metalloprotease [bacterium]|nr:CPBP family intramembrane metalloprotease [bacterium]